MRHKGGEHVAVSAQSRGLRFLRIRPPSRHQHDVVAPIVEAPGVAPYALNNEASAFVKPLRGLVAGEDLQLDALDPGGLRSVRCLFEQATSKSATAPRRRNTHTELTYVGRARAMRPTNIAPTNELAAVQSREMNATAGEALEHKVHHVFERRRLCHRQPSPLACNRVK